MGRGSYTAKDWAKLKESRKLDSSSVNQIFKAKKMDDKFDPKYIDKREARDNEEHPNSTPIMIGVDVTGSMGYLSEEIIKNSLDALMRKLYSTNIVEDPQLLFAAIGDASVDRAPLQVTQFESDIRIAEQLMDLWIEGSGGDSPEDYELLWYFADKHTDIDSYNKRQKKGFCFTIGDAEFHDELSKQDIKKIFNDNAQDLKSKAIADAASEKYELFHIDLNCGRHSAASLIPGRVISMKSTDVKYLPEVIIAAMQLTNGISKDKILDGLDFAAKKVIRQATADLNVGKKLKF